MLDKLAAPSFAKSIVNLKGGPARLNAYRVILPTQSIGGDAISMDVLCRGATLPGRSINTVARRTNMKEIQTPIGYVNTPIDMVFTETNDHTVKHYFDKWLDKIVNPRTYEVAWRDDITEDILIMSNDQSGIPGYICKLRNAYPKTKTQIDLSDNASDSIMEVRIQLEYEDYEIIDSPLIGGAMDFAKSLRTGSVQLPTNIIRAATEGLF
jgi:hypothetical protein